MPGLMRCPFCGHLQDEPAGVKECAQCGGGLEFEPQPPAGGGSYLQAQLELDQVAAPAGRNVERHLLVTLRTPAQVPAAEMPPAAQERPPVNFTAVVDVSGSMQGEKLHQAGEAVRQALHCLHAGDVFALVTFNNEVACPCEPVVLDAASLRRAEESLTGLRAGGMTALDGGLALGLEKALVHRQETNLVLLLSDGQTNVGEKDLEVIGLRAQKARQQGVLVSALGVGLDYNEALLAEIASQGGGRFYHLEHARQIPAYVAGELKDVAGLAARGLQVHLDLPPGATLVPLSAAFPVSQQGTRAVVEVGDLPPATELEIPLRLALLAQRAGARLQVEGKLTFRSPAGNALELSLNRVTVRFMAAGKFSLQQGVAAPVVERVLEQMRAVNVLEHARLYSRQPQEADKHTAGSVQVMRAYAALLGEARADQEAQRLSERFSAMHADRGTSKQAVAAAYTSMRGGKKHG